jgi:hypothetical protein
MSAGTSLGDVPDWLKVPDAGTLVGILAETAKAGLVAGITPAEDFVIAGALRAAGEQGRIGFFRSRPLLSDAIATAAALASVAETTVAGFHLRQISCRDPLTLVADAVRRGDVDFWAAPGAFGRADDAVAVARRRECGPDHLERSRSAPCRGSRSPLGAVPAYGQFAPRLGRGHRHRGFGVPRADPA